MNERVARKAIKLVVGDALKTRWPGSARSYAEGVRERTIFKPIDNKLFNKLLANERITGLAEKFIEENFIGICDKFVQGNFNAEFIVHHNFDFKINNNELKNVFDKMFGKMGLEFGVDASPKLKNIFTVNVSPSKEIFDSLDKIIPYEMQEFRAKVKAILGEPALPLKRRGGMKKYDIG